MFTSVEYKQFDFEEIKDKVIIVSLNPFSSRLNKKRYNTVFMAGNQYYDLAKKVQMKLHNWVELNYLAIFVAKHDGQVINSI